MATTANAGLMSASAVKMSGRTALMRAVYGGTETLRAAEKLYLPQHERETDIRYRTRLAATTALNKLREAVEAASAKPFKTRIKLLNNTDPELETWIKDCDLQGNHLHIFAHQHFNDALHIGQSHIFVDHPTTANLPNLAAQKASGARPFLKHIRDEDLRAAYNENVGGDIQTTHVRIFSQRIEREPGTFKEILWNQIYVIEKEVGATQGVVQLWEQAAEQGGEEWTLMGENPLTIPEVPFVTLYAGEKEADFVTRPLFLDLAYKQIEHLQSSSDQRSILTAARFPMLAASGVEIDEDDQDKFAVGPYQVLYAPDPQGRWYYVEPAGRAIESGFKDLSMLEIQMDMMALNPVVATHRQYVPQNERDIQETRVHSVIHDIALSEKDALEKSIRFMGMWTNKDYSLVQTSLNVDFSNTKEKIALLGLMLQAYEKRGISRQTFLEEARQNDLFQDDFDVEKELERLAQVDESVPVGGSPGPVAGGPDDPVRKSTTAPVDFPNGGDRPKRQI